MSHPRPDPPINASLDALPDPWTPPATVSRAVGESKSRASGNRGTSGNPPSGNPPSEDSLTEDSRTEDSPTVRDGVEDPLAAARGILVGVALSFLLGALAVVRAWAWR